MNRKRIRDLGIVVGDYPTGPFNAITDVPGVWVGHTTLIRDRPRVARTGVTIIQPRENTIRDNPVFAGYHIFNGNGEMSGLAWLAESGMLGSPIALTNTNQVGTVHDALIRYTIRAHRGVGFRLPVVAETWDGWLNDIDAFHIKDRHVFSALEGARSGPVEEGNVGGGTGMICHEFKGGVGTSSRVADTKSGRFTIGALVQANHGDRRDFRINGRPIGRLIGVDQVPLPWDEPFLAGSIIVILATDAPLLPVQCKRLAQRAAIGFVRCGGVGHNGSGDIFLAFATGNHLPSSAGGPIPIQMMPHGHLDPIFIAAGEAVEEAILNSLTMAETMAGSAGRVAHALPLDGLFGLVVGAGC